ncbi:MAG: MoaD/ThiS family protein [Candidatus Helarchaeota archaeon]
MIRVKFFSILAELAGTREIEIETKTNSYIPEIIPLIFNKTNKKLKKKIFDDDKGFFKDFITVVLNEKVLNKDEILTKKLNDGDILAILTPIEGG